MPLSFTLLILFFGCATTQPKIAVDSTSALPAGEVTFKGNPLTLIGEPISVGQPLPSVELTDAETTGDVDLSQEKGSVLLLSIVPSLDTPLCEEQTHYLGEQGKWLPALVKLPAYKAGLPGKEMDSIWIVPLHPAYKAGLAGHAPVRRITVSRDTPFAQKRFAKEAKLTQIRHLSDYKEGAFGRSTGLLIDGLALLARAVILVDKEGIVRYMQVVPELTHLPDMEKAFNQAAELAK